MDSRIEYGIRQAGTDRVFGYPSREAVESMLAGLDRDGLNGGRFEAVERTVTVGEWEFHDRTAKA